ncbi:MAG: LssY C-terminal domain-containing protein [Candidatus Magasanikbacteria bacterium]|nr:LssY C-terminal domain-containing protein [Candidatus Magasanikbacteria bacterium]
MNFVKRTTERVVIAVFTFIVWWFVVTQIFDRLEQRMPVFLAGVLTYLLAAYILLPRVIQFCLMILRRGRVPRFARAADGLPADPVNIILIGSQEMLRNIFTIAGWHEAEPITWRSVIKMMHAIIRNKSYANAPFSSLYLFGRKQDHGFQQPIGKSPRHRHHVRFWAANLDPEADMTNFKYWMQKHSINPKEASMWVGSGTKDIGLALKRFTYQITHKVDKNVDEERDYVISSLRETGLLAKEYYSNAEQFIIGKYKSDGRILTAYIK